MKICFVFLRRKGKYAVKEGRTAVNDRQSARERVRLYSDSERN